MSVPSGLMTRSLLVGVLLVSTAYGASAMTVSKARVLIDGAYMTVLVVEDGDKVIIHRAGEDGLTRSILFNEKKALDWARKKYGAEVQVDEEGFDAEGTLYGSRDDDNDDGGGGSS